jgi:cytosine/adenosine deaminase-related metal-dependent hydrolase
MILRARLLLPMGRPPIQDGAIVVAGNRITELGRWREVSSHKRGEVYDLGEVILMPGLVNAHCHLDYTNMVGQFHPPKVFIDWLKLITTTKAGWDYSDYIESWANGAQMLVRTGTTTVADVEAVPELLPDVWSRTPLRVISFLEMIGITGRRSAAVILREILEQLDSPVLQGHRFGLSPHAPYSTLPELLRLSGVAARQRGWRVTTHVAESAVEFEMLAEGKGAMFDWLRRSTRDMSDCGFGSPVQHLERCGLLGNNLLAIHVNYLGKADAALLARRGVHVVHCPRSHSYFGHAAFPLRRLHRAGVNVCLGTDSLASVHKTRRQPVELNLFEEMRALAATNPWLSPRTILRMTTLNSARALGMTGQVGELAKRALADLIVVPFAGRAREIYEAVLAHTGRISASMIDGRWAIEPSSN